jgi:hypothetical protein
VDNHTLDAGDIVRQSTASKEDFLVFQEPVRNRSLTWARLPKYTVAE